MIELYLLFIEEFDNVDLAEYEIYLDKSEKIARERFVFQKDRNQYLLTRMLTRRILAEKTNQEPTDLRFDKNQYGKPFLKGIKTDFSFNISHTSGLILLAVQKDTKTIGVDVENTMRKVNLDQVMPTVFAEEEIEAISQQPESKQKEHFFDFWTVKEAYMKAEGKGFYLPPKSFKVSFESDKIELKDYLTRGLINEYDYCLLDQYWPYKIAICHEKGNAKINLYRLTPSLKTEVYLSTKNLSQSY